MSRDWILGIVTLTMNVKRVQDTLLQFRDFRDVKHQVNGSSNMAIYVQQCTCIRKYQCARKAQLL